MLEWNITVKSYIFQKLSNTKKLGFVTPGENVKITLYRPMGHRSTDFSNSPKTTNNYYKKKCIHINCTPCKYFRKSFAKHFVGAGIRVHLALLRQYLYCRLQYLYVGMYIIIKKNRYSNILRPWINPLLILPLKSLIVK